MNLNSEFNIENIKNISLEEKKFRQNSLNLFKEKGFPNKRLEEWKFTDLGKIINENFKELNFNNVEKNDENIELIKDFEHNSIVLINGFLKSKNFKYENEENIKISEYKNSKKNIKDESVNSLIDLNNAFFGGGYFLEISKDYKFCKPLVVYNYFSNNLKNTIINNKNSIVLNENSNLDLIEFNLDISSSNFIHNNHTNIIISKNASLKNYTIQGCKSNCFYYKFVKSKLDKKSNYEDYIFLSGLKFSRTEEDIDIDGEDANCIVQSALYLDLENHQEVKTKLNHLKPNCKSYQKIKNVLNKKSKSAYQGKIFVKDIAQKTDAYQLSKALLLDDSSEFNAKPELEIYADDVKCSHGSTSGSINEDSIYYLMTRGISKKKAIELLTKAFLFEIADSISNVEIKNFVEKNIDRQIYGY